MTEIVDPSRRARLVSLKRVLKRIRSDAAELTWELGNTLAEVQRDELWREDGAESFAAWCEPHGEISSSSAYRAIALARHFTREMASRFGSDKLDATATYLEATKKLEQPGDVLALRIRVPGQGGRFRSVPYPDATAAQIRLAAKLVRQASSGKDAAPAEPHVRERLTALEKAMPQAPGGTVRGERIKLKRGTDGREALTVQGIPVDAIPAFAEALLRAFAGH